MRRFLLTASALAALAAGTSAASAQYYYDAADVDSYTYGPPPRAYVAPPVTYATPRTYVTPAPVVEAPMVESQVYLSPGTAPVMQPGVAYQDQAVYVNGRRYYRDCWWDWGQRRCELKPWW
jgi:hypothetical protein